MPDLPLLMTASVSTHGMKGADFSDEERETMYAETLSFYIRTLQKDRHQKIVFAENSDWDLNHLIRRLPEFDSSLIEFISVPHCQFDIAKGKGYNEMLLINYAVNTSSFIKEAGAFFKVTGRYPIYNLDYFIRSARESLSRGKVLYADIKDHKLYDYLNLGWEGHSFECRLFAATTAFYLRYFAPLYTSCNDYQGQLMESVLFNALISNKLGGGISLRFRREPHFGGLEGSNINSVSFTKKQDSLKGKFKRCIGNFVRVVFPSFYF